MNNETNIEQPIEFKIYRDGRIDRSYELKKQLRSVSRFVGKNLATGFVGVINVLEEMRVAFEHEYTR